MSGDRKPWLRGRMSNRSMAFETVGVLRFRKASSWSRESFIRGFLLLTRLPEPKLDFPFGGTGRVGRMHQIIQPAVPGIGKLDRVRAQVAANRPGRRNGRLRRADQHANLRDG